MSVPRLTVRRLGGGIIAAVAALGLAPFTAAAATDPDQVSAVVSAPGGLVRGSSGASVVKLGVGQYEVRFRRDVSRCAYTATIGDTGNQLQYYPGEVFTAGGHLSARGVFVETKNPGGGLSDYPFHLNVNCSTKRSNPWAVVSAPGGLVRGSSGASVIKLGVGQYEVRLPADVSYCAYTATIGDTGNQLQYYPGEVFTAGGHLSARGVFVETKNPGGGLTDYPFHLNVNCSTKRTNPWAVVNANGGLVRAPNGTSVVKLGIGQYEVRLPADVSRCAYTATIGDTGNQLQYYPGEVFTAGGHLGADGVFVETKNPGGGLTDYPFHLNVGC